MGLPRYIINPEDFVDSFHKVVLKGKTKGEIYKGVQRSKGIRLHFESNDTFIQKKVQDICGFTLSGFLVERQFHEKNQPDEFWTLKIDDNILYDSIYMKNENIWKALEIFIDIPKDAEVVFEYHNTSGIEKSVWVEFDYLSNMELVGGGVE